MRRDMNVWADGLTSYAHHQTGQDYELSGQYEAHLYKNGCWDCHTVHTDGVDGLPYQLDRDWYSLEDGVGCMECHGSTASQQIPPQENLLRDTVYNGRTVNAHSMHSLENSQCVNCHFTKVASIGFIQLPTKPLYEFTDHSFRVIPPSATRVYKDAGQARLGMINTCSESCHRNGRGSRNLDASKPAAPDFGTFDRPDRIGTWNDPADLALADSLQFHWDTMFAKFSHATPETGLSFASMAIHRAAPNPFTDATKITFSLARASSIELDVFDLSGAKVTTLASGHHTPGAYSVTWDGTGLLKEPLSAGTYVVRLRAGTATTSTKVILTR
jgi:hypothetical protein